MQLSNVHPSSGYRKPADPAADCWPTGLLEAFTLRMSSHGHCVSGCLMLVDSGYATQQIAHAHCLADDQLHSMASNLMQRLPSAASRPLAS